MSRRITIHHPKRKEPVLWIVDSEQWPRACLRAELIERGYDPYGFITIADAFESMSRGRSPKPEALILELRDQNVTGPLLEAIRNLRISTIVLAGNLELNDSTIAHHHWNLVLK